jgi:hypothetical protein
VPVHAAIMRALKRQYGEKKGERTYYAMENAGKLPHQRKRKRHK